MDGRTIPLGCKFRFDPEDDEILVYLKCKSNGESLPGEGFIKEVDLYGLTDPGVLFKGTEEKVVYVFTKLKKVAKNGKRVERSVSGNRTWKGVDAGKPIYNVEGGLVGERKNFVLMNKMKMKLGYNMTEFSLTNDSLRNSRFKDFVVCKIKKKDKKFRSLKDGNFSKEDIYPSTVSWPATEEGDAMASVVSATEIEGDPTAFVSGEGYICPSSVFAPTIEGELMASVAEEGYQYEDNSIILSQSQYQAQNFDQFSESNVGIGNFMAMVCEGFDSDKAFSEGNLYGGVNLWTTETTVEENNQLEISWDDLFAPTQDLLYLS